MMAIPAGIEDSPARIVASVVVRNPNTVLPSLLSAIPTAVTINPIKEKSAKVKDRRAKFF